MLFSFYEYLGLDLFLKFVSTVNYSNVNHSHLNRLNYVMFEYLLKKNCEKKVVNSFAKFLNEEAIDDLIKKIEDDEFDSERSLERSIQRKIFNCDRQQFFLIVKEIFINVFQQMISDLHVKFSTQYKKLLRFKKIFNFDEVEFSILLLLYMIDKRIGIIGSLDEFFSLDYDSIDQTFLFLTGESSGESQKIRNYIQNLRRHRFIEDGSVSLELDSVLKDMFLNYDCENHLEFLLLEQTKVKVEGYSSIPLKDEEIIEKMMKVKSSQILLYGFPGTGKTTIAHNLALKSGKKLFCIPHDKDVNRNDRLSRLSMLLKLDANEEYVFLVDEADHLFEDRMNNKQIINHILDNAKSTIFWITNSIHSLDTSTMRRFSYCCEFKLPTDKERKLILEKVVNDLGMQQSFTSGNINLLAKKYQLSAGPIADSLKAIAKINEVTPVKNLELLEQTLEQYCYIMNHRVDKSIIIEKDQSQKKFAYQLDMIHSDTDLNRVIERARKFYSNPHASINNYNLLLSGPPGTGKTEFVKQLAELLDRELIIKRYSDLQSMWVGECERKIAQAFKDAQKDGAILFIDEADSFFKNRSDAERNWEVSQTNELLCQMEEFNGMFICATNYYQNIDMGAYRRFAEKIKFEYLKPDDALQVYLTQLQPHIGHEMSQSQIKQLKSIVGLAFGDFKVCLQKALLGDMLSHEEMILQLHAEALSRVKRKPIGF